MANTIEIYQQLLRSNEAKKELIRKLEMIKFYKKKNDLESLGVKCNDWKQVSQCALDDLLTKNNQHCVETPKTMKELLDHLGISSELVGWSEAEQCWDVNL